jgi:hypothetical protein
MHSKICFLNSFIFRKYIICDNSITWICQYLLGCFRFALKHVNQQNVHVCNQWQGPLWSCSHGSWTSNYLCNQWLSTLKLWVRISLDTTLKNKCNNPQSFYLSRKMALAIFFCACDIQSLTTKGGMVIVFNATFNSYIVVVCFIGGWNRCIPRSDNNWFQKSDNVIQTENPRLYNFSSLIIHGSRF